MSTPEKDIAVTAASTSETSSQTGSREPRHWYRSTLFNAFVIGGVGFTAPGLWNAMNALGAGGGQSPFLGLHAS